MEKEKIDNDSYNEYQKIYQYSRDKYGMDIPAIRIDVAIFLEVITKILKPKNILEIGFGSGVSSFFILKNIYKNDNVKLTSLEKDKKKCDIGNELYNNILKIKNIEIINTEALNYLQNNCNMYDFVFIDGPKKEYLKQFELLSNKIKENGIIICDNIFFNNNIFKNDNEIPKKHIPIKKSMIDFHNYLIMNTKFTTFFLNIGDGLSLSIKN